jgi:hypothetical protein
MPEEVERGPSAERDRGNGVEPVGGVTDRDDARS